VENPKAQRYKELWNDEGDFVGVGIGIIQKGMNDELGAGVMNNLETENFGNRGNFGELINIFGPWEYHEGSLKRFPQKREFPTVVDLFKGGKGFFENKFSNLVFKKTFPYPEHGEGCRGKGGPQK